jgi:hypothetical protein
MIVSLNTVTLNNGIELITPAMLNLVSGGGPLSLLDEPTNH